MPILTAEERVGTVLGGKYRLLEVLAHGGMGVLFRAEHTWTGRHVAVKMLRARELTPDEAAAGRRLDRFVLEARTATRVAHPNVVDVLDMGAAEDGTPFLALELLHGESLAARLGRTRTVSIEDALSWMLPIMGALAIAHDRDIVHRDLKPANVFLALDGSGRVTPKLLDFGIAKVSDQTTLTDPGTAVGTPDSMSPEQATGQGVIGPATDVWAMGVLLYTCLAGAAPFSADTPARVLLRIVNERPATLAKLAPHVPSAVCAVIERALEKRIEQRYANMRAFAQALTVTAHGVAIALPASPDPIGLPGYAAWRSLADQSATGDAHPFAPPLQVTPAPAPASGPAPTRRARAAGIVIAGALAVAAWTFGARDSAAPQAPAPAITAPPPPAPSLSTPTLAPEPDAGIVRAAAPVRAEPPAAQQRKRRKARERAPAMTQPAAENGAGAVPALKPTW